MLSAWLAAYESLEGGSLSLYPSDLFGRLQWTLEVGRSALCHRRHSVRVLCHLRLVKFKSVPHCQHSKSIIECSVFVEKQAPSETLQKHSFIAGQLCDIY